MTSPAGGAVLGSGLNALLPSYAKGCGLSYDPARNVANWKAKNTHRIRSACAIASSGGLAPGAFIADSLGAGFNGVGNTNDPEQSYPAQLLDFLVNETGNKNPIAYGGSGARYGCAANAVAAGGWANTGGFNFNAPFINTVNGGTATWTSPRNFGAGVSVILTIWGQSAAGQSFTVGGGAANPIVPDGVAHWQQITLAGQTVNAGTLIVVTCGAGTTFYVDAVEIRSGSGLVLHNAGLGGGRLNSGGNTINWNDFSQASNMAPARLGALPANLYFVFIQLGGNDMDVPGTDPIAIANGYATLLAQAPLNTAQPILITSWCKPTTPNATWQSYLTQCYKVARLLDCPLIDWNDRVQGQATAQTDGMLGPDNVHGTYGAYAQFGKADGDNILQ